MCPFTISVYTPISKKVASEIGNVVFVFHNPKQKERTCSIVVLLFIPFVSGCETKTLFPISATFWK